MAAVFELRIHSGTHAGAHELLAGNEQLVGSGSDCDFVLSEPGLLPRHARLNTGADGLRLHLLDRPDEEGGGLQPGRLHWLGSVLISVAEADSPWPGEAELAFALNEGPSTPGQAMPEPTLSLAPEGPVDLSGAALEVQPPPAVPVRAGFRPWRWPLFMALIGGGILVLIGMTRSLMPDPTPFEAAAQADKAKSSPEHRQAMRLAATSVLNSLALGDRVRLFELPDDRWQVRASLLDEDEYEQLAAALSKLKPRPGLVVTTEQDLQSLVAQALANEEAQHDLRLSARALGRGRFRLEGSLTDAVTRELVLARLRKQLPAPIVLDSALYTREERAMQLLSALREAGVGEVQGRWTEDQLDVQVSLADTEVAKWERALLSVTSRYPGVPFKARTRLRPTAAPHQLPAVLATLPFKLQSVVGGVTPYVVLGDGSKLMVGGRHQGWLLVAIAPESVIFEGQGARRAQVPR